jgi:hypothetical protein
MMMSWSLTPNKVLSTKYVYEMLENRIASPNNKNLEI